VYEGNEKLILGMIWMLIQQYHIRVIGECSYALGKGRRP